MGPTFCAGVCCLKESILLMSGGKATANERAVGVVGVGVGEERARLLLY